MHDRKDDDYEWLQLKRKRQQEEDAEFQKKQIAQVKGVTAYYGLFSRIWGTIAGGIKITGHTIGVLSQIIPPINALISGIVSILETIEAIFLSKETINNRVVKGANSLIGTGLGIAALVLAFNPATAPIGLALSTGSIFISFCKEVYFLSIGLDDLKKAERDFKNKVHDYIKTEHSSDIARVKEINRQIFELQKDPSSLTSNVSKLSHLQDEKEAIFRKIDVSVKNNEKLQSAKENLASARKFVKDKKIGVFNSALSLGGVGLITVGAFLGAVGLVATLNVVGFAALTLVTAIVVGVTIHEKFFNQNKSTQKATPSTEKKPSSPHDQFDNHLHDHDVRKIYHEISAHQNDKSEKTMIQKGIETPTSKIDEVDDAKARVTTKPRFNDFYSEEKKDVAQTDDDKRGERPHF